MDDDQRPTSAFDYDLPQELIAQRPADRRDRSRLMVLERASGRIEHRVFSDFPTLVARGDAVVLNETRVLPARLLGRKPTGAAAEILLLRPAAGEDTWHALVRPGAKLKPGATVEVGADLSVVVLESAPDGTRTVRLVSESGVRAALERYGRIPLPPYIERDADASDTERYQTVYAREEGSVAAPTAGLHFTEPLLAGLEAGGVRLVRLLLHIGVGTFRPVETENPAEHDLHAEWYRIGEDAAAALNETRGNGGRIWAVGTTVARTLETSVDPAGRFRAGTGWTKLFIRGSHRFRGVDRLVTNFHLPRSTLLMLVAAFAGYDLIMEAYARAVAERYRFYSYGDAMAIL